MKRNALALLVTLIFAVAIATNPAAADGIIIPQPPICDPWPCPPQPFPFAQLEIRYHHVTVEIIDQVATTHVDQVFYNPNDWQIEGTYIFPIPHEAVVTDFALWIDGKPILGTVLRADEARQTYEKIVRSYRDPALLMYIDRGAVQASIFPIPPGGERKIELTYSQVLTAENGLVKYVYPLNTEKFSVEPLENVSVSVEIHSSEASIRSVYSPSHSVSVERENDREVIAGYEENDVRPDTDFTLYYSVGAGQALHLVAYRDPGQGADHPGYFMLLLDPQIETSLDVLPKDIILVLDNSGSMDGEKFLQAQKALGHILNHLNPDDTFNIGAFSTGIQIYSEEMKPASEAAEGIDWVNSLSAQGSTDINRALLEAAAISNPSRPIYLIFLTDGLPTEGVVESQQILDNFAINAPENIRIFSFGVGYDVDTYLLDSLSQGHRGMTTYVQPGDPLDEILSKFYTKISTPVLTDLALDFGDVVVSDVYPDPLPDLFSGSQIVILGRYQRGGRTTIDLSGKQAGEDVEFQYREYIFPRGFSRTLADDAVIARLWATRKIGYLLNKVRLAGPDSETIDQIIELSIRYGIVTPYTSYLITESEPLSMLDRERISKDALQDAQRAVSAPSFGENAVHEAADQGALAAADAPAEMLKEADEIVRYAEARTFLFVDGVWVDTIYSPGQFQTVEIEFLSEDYFDLLVNKPTLASALALGNRVIVVADGMAYEIVTVEASAREDSWPSTTDEEPHYSAPQSTYIDPKVGPPAVSETSTLDEPIAVPRSASGGLCVYGLVPLALIPLIYIRKRSLK